MTSLVKPLCNIKTAASSINKFYFNKYEYILSRKAYMSINEPYLENGTIRKLF